MIDPLLVETLASRASGSAGALTFGRNQHGPWVRDRITPSDPATPDQFFIRFNMIRFTDRWATFLTPAQRDSWDLYARNVFLPGRLGRSNHVGALPHYLRSNLPRAQLPPPVFPIVDTAPQDFDLGPFTPVPRIVLNIVNDTFHPFFTPTDAWATEQDAAMLFWVSAPKPLSVNFYKGPYTSAQPIAGQPVPRLRSPATLPLPFPAGPGQRVFVRGRVTQADGRLSPSFRLPADALPQVPPLPISVTSVFLFPSLTVFVQFDHLLTGLALSTAPWSIRFLDRVWDVISVRVSDDTLRLGTTRGIFSPGPDTVTFAPPPADVIALLTGIPAAGFSLPIP